MNASETRTAIVRALGVFASRDPVRIAEVLHEDVEWHGPAGNATAAYLNRPLPMVGRETVAAFLATGFRELFHDAEVTITALTVDADRAVAGALALRSPPHRRERRRRCRPSLPARTRCPQDDT